MSHDTASLLFAGLIDDAGMFPPASKPLEHAIADHIEVRHSSEHWMLGRFLCPLSRLDALTARSAEVPRVGVVFDVPATDWPAPVATGVERVLAWERYADVTAIELRLPAQRPGEAVRQLAQHPAVAKLDGRVPLFLEVALREQEQMAEALDAIAHTDPAVRFGAKVRLGGATAEAFPPNAAVASFVSQAVHDGVPFKATAGLHHPFRTTDTSLDVLQHGFVNLLAAVALPAADTVTVISETVAAAFQIDGSGLTWRGQHADHTALALARTRLTAFGSCSFSEPAADLTTHGILTAGATV
jgi:hypothetical protein